MDKEFVEKANNYLKIGGFFFLIISILLSFFIYNLCRFTSICFEPDLCKKAEENMVNIKQN